MREDEEIFGLLSDGRPVPLEGVSVEAEIKDFCSRVTISQRYRNPEGDPIEAVYVFPLADDAEPAPSEIVFLIDRSGSMEGTSIEEARNALQLCLRSLPAGTRFNIVGFGSTFEKVFPESRDYDDQSLAQAGAHGSVRVEVPGSVWAGYPSHIETPFPMRCWRRTGETCRPTCSNGSLMPSYVP